MKACCALRWQLPCRIFNALHLEENIFDAEKAPAIWKEPDQLVSVPTHHIKRDQLAAVPVHHSPPSRRLDETLDILPNLDDAPVLAKTNIFYFVGGTSEKNVAYSHGVRQTIWALYHDRPGASGCPCCTYASALQCVAASVGYVSGNMQAACCQHSRTSEQYKHHTSMHLGCIVCPDWRISYLLAASFLLRQ